MLGRTSLATTSDQVRIIIRDVLSRLIVHYDIGMFVTELSVEFGDN